MSRTRASLWIAVVLPSLLAGCDGEPIAPEPPMVGSDARVGYVFRYGPGQGTIADIRSIDPQGGNEKLLAGKFLLWPAASSSGGALVGGRNNHIVILDLHNNSERTLLRTEHKGDNIRADWSPGDAQIVYHSSDISSSHIFVVDTAHASVPRLIGGGREPIWSPAHDSIAFVGFVDGVLGLAIMAADGSGRRLISNEENMPIGPGDWSPDGEAMVGSRSLDGIHNAIFVLSRDGTELRQLTTPPEGTSDNSARWSPDGLMIAFVRRFNQGPGSDQLLVVNTDGGDPRPLISACRTCGENIHSVFWLPPAPSP